MLECQGMLLCRSQFALRFFGHAQCREREFDGFCDCERILTELRRLIRGCHGIGGSLGSTGCADSGGPLGPTGSVGSTGFISPMDSLGSMCSVGSIGSVGSAPRLFDQKRRVRRMIFRSKARVLQVNRGDSFINKTTWHESFCYWHMNHCLSPFVTTFLRTKS